MDYLLAEKDLTFQIDFDLDHFPKIRYSSRSLIFVTFAIALSVHLALLWIMWSPYYKPSVYVPHHTSVEITLVRQSQKEIDSITLQENIHEPSQNAVQAEQEKNIQSVKLNPVSIASQKRVEKETTVSLPPKSLELLSAQDYQEISKSREKISTQDTLAFNPGLKKLRNETRRTAVTKNRHADLDWQDTIGNLYYKSGGHCFMSPAKIGPPAINEAKNWYLIPCPGKSDSEKMMDNVNQEMRERFGRE